MVMLYSLSKVSFLACSTPIGKKLDSKTLGGVRKKKVCTQHPISKPFIFIHYLVLTKF